MDALIRCYLLAAALPNPIYYVRTTFKTRARQSFCRTFNTIMPITSLHVLLLLLLFCFLGLASSFHARSSFGEHEYEVLTERKGGGVLDPTQVKQLSWNPRVFLHAGFLSDEECDHLISLAKGRLLISMVEDEETGEGIQSQERTSTGMFLRRGQVYV